jgi:hypothetical protein
MTTTMNLACSVIWWSSLIAVCPARAGDTDKTANEANDQAIATIRALYRAAGEVEAGTDGERTNVATMQLDTVQPGTGPQRHELTFVLGEHRASDEQIYADLYVMKARCIYNIAARQFVGEYLFDGPGGDLVFSFWSDGETELRLYLDDGALIRAIRQPAPGGSGGTQLVDAAFPPDTLAQAETARRLGAQYLDLFRQLDSTLTAETGR